MADAASGTRFKRGHETGARGEENENGSGRGEGGRGESGEEFFLTRPRDS